MYTSMEWGVYVFFATALICASVYAFFFIHDTKGLRMDQMDELFGFEKREEFIVQADGKSADYESEHHEKAPVQRTEAV
jgi:hypothetical protein